MLMYEVLMAISSLEWSTHLPLCPDAGHRREGGEDGEHRLPVTKKNAVWGSNQRENRLVVRAIENVKI